MKQLIINIVLVLIILLFAGMTFNQCSVKRGVQAKLTKCNADYLALVRAKVRIDTVYKSGKTQVVNKTHFKTITDSAAAFTSCPVSIRGVIAVLKSATPPAERN